MNKHRYHRLLRATKCIEVKCDRILSILDVMRSEGKDSLLESIKESARDMYQCSLEERRRTGKFFNLLRHD